MEHPLPYDTLNPIALDFSPLNLLGSAAMRKPNNLHLVGVAHPHTSIFEGKLDSQFPQDLLITEQTTVTQSYDLALRLVTLLKEHGVSTGDRVAIYGPNTIWHLLIHFACAGVQAISVPLDQHYQPDELNVVLNDCAPKLVFAGPAQESRLLQTNVKNAFKVISLSVLPSLVTSREPTLGNNLPNCNEDVLGTIIYTSGTTSHPKGVALTHANLWWGCRNFREVFEYSSDCVEAVVAPLSHIGGFNGTTLDLAYSGGTVVVIEGFNAETVLAVFERFRVQMMFGVPTIYQRLLSSSAFNMRDLSSFSRPLIGGSPLPLPVAQKMHEVGWFPYNVWGMTEQSASGTCLTPGMTSLSLNGVGVPFPFTQVRIVDIEQAEAGVLVGVPSGIVGMLVCAGPSVTRGYWQDEGLSESSFIDGWLLTGDLGFVDGNGVIQFVARASDTVMTGGEKVLPEPVAEVLRTMPGVRDAQVVGIADDEWGQAVAAVLLPNLDFPEGVALNSFSDSEVLALVRDYAGQYLARYKLPRAIRVVESFPVSSNGKVSKLGLQDLFSS